MSDSYQAVYDAVRSRIHSVDMGTIFREALGRFDISHDLARISEEFMVTAIMGQRPSILYRPTVSPDGSKWCALYGPNLAEGVSGFGDTPEQAMADFDANWCRRRTPEAVRHGAEPFWSPSDARLNPAT